MLSDVQRAIQAVHLEVDEEDEKYISLESASAPVAPHPSSRPAAASTAAASGDVELQLSISGMTCASCVATIQRHLLTTFPSWLHTCEINLLTESGRVLYSPSHPDASVAAILSEVEDIGFEATVRETAELLPNQDGHTTTKAEEMVASKKRVVSHYWRLLIFCLIFAVPVFLLSMVLMYIPASESALMTPIYNSFTINSLLMWVLCTPVQLGVGQIFYRSAWKGLKARSANMSLLVAVGTTAAYVYALIDVIDSLRSPMDMHVSSSSGAHFFETASTLITFIILGRLLEAIAKGKTSEALTKLTGMQASMATLLLFDGSGRVVGEREVAVTSLKRGDVVKVNRGSKVPADGVVVYGESSVDESFITGESLPVLKTLDSPVIGSSVNHEATLHVRVTAAASESTLANILRLMESAQTAKAPIQKVADTISGIFVPAVIGLALLTWIVWFILQSQGALPQHWIEKDGEGSGFLFSFLFGLSVVVIACPCALGLATPTAVMVGTGVGARMGILIKGGSALEVAHKVSAIVLDKTGT